jgi:hypothetical protein
MSDTPNSPLDLVSRQTQPNPEEHTHVFFDRVGELMDEICPCPCEVQQVAERLVYFLHGYHSNMLNSEGSEMSEWARATWKADRKRLKKALSLIRDVH